MWPRLGVNVDHVATLRQARGKVRYPDPVHAAYIAEAAGADQITVHLREDRRHIQDRDIKILKDTVQTRLNLEMANTQEMVKVALYVVPHSATLVPERREEVTTEGGLDVKSNAEALKKTTAMLREAGIKVCMFIDPDIDQVRASHKAGADAIEIHTGRFCEAWNTKTEDREFQNIFSAMQASKKLGMAVHAGHGLHYSNIKRLLQIREIEEYNIGHSIIARAVISGLEKAVSEMADIIRHG